MHYSNSGKKHYMLFDSMTETVDFIIRHKDSIARAPQSPFDELSGTYDKIQFQGGTTEKCLDMALNGYPEALEKYHALSAAVPIPVPRDTEMHTIHDVSGAYVDMGAFMSGVPECMVDFKQEPTNKFATIYIDCSYRQRTSPDDVLIKYMYIVRLIDHFESQDIRCKVFIGSASEGAKSNEQTECEIWINVKNHYTPLNLSTLLYACHLSALRVIVFSLRGYLMREQGMAAKNVGYFIGMSESKVAAADGGIYIPNMYHDVFCYRADMSNFDQFVIRYLSNL